MGLTLKDTGGGGEFQLPPEGSHVATCTQLIDLGLQEVVWQGRAKMQPKVLIGWELAEETYDTEEGPKPFIIWNRYTASLDDRSTLRKHLKSWRGRDFTEDELDGFSLKNIVGAPCILSIVHKKSTDGTKTYANVAAVGALTKSMKKPEQKTTTIVFDLESWDQDTFDSFSEHLQATINASQERKAMLAAKRHSDSPDFDAANAEAGAADDDIPF